MSKEINNESRGDPVVFETSPCARKGPFCSRKLQPAHESFGDRTGPRSGLPHSASRGRRRLQGARVQERRPLLFHFPRRRDGIKEYREEAAKLTGEASITLLFRHLSASRLVTIAQIEGRVRGAGSEFVLACDMRFAARESAIFSQSRRSVCSPAGAPPNTSRASWAARGRSRSCSARRIGESDNAGYGIEIGVGPW
jgi:hypothetical protein